MALLTVQNITRAGVAIAYPAASAGGDQFLPSEDTFVWVYNSGGGAITATIATPGTVAGGIGIADIAVSVPASGNRMIGPFPTTVFADPADGLADITYSGVSSVTVGYFHINQP